MQTNTKTTKKNPNIYIGAMQDVMHAYYKKLHEYNKQIADNNARFTAEYAKPENDKILEQKTKAYNEAKQKIIDIFKDVREMLACASFLNVESLTADRLFFEQNSGFSLSVAEVQAYVERYKNNYTMLRLISDWIAKQDKPAYSSISIILPKDILNAYKTFADGALSIVEKIHDEGRIMESPIELETFADDNWSHNLYDIVGSGLSLNEYKTKRVPNTAMHTFDDVTLKSDPNYFMSAV